MHQNMIQDCRIEKNKDFFQRKQLFNTKPLRNLFFTVAVFVCISQSSFGESVNVVNSIKDLKNLTVETTDHDMLVRVKYYGDSNGNEIIVNGIPVKDEGGGIFKLDTQTALTSVVLDDGINLSATVSNGTGFWKRVFSGRVNVCWYGVKTNGSSDDSALFQKAIDYIRGVNGGSSSPTLYHQGIGLYVPAGTYYIGSTLDLTYSGSSGGTNTQYFGLSIYGSDKYQTNIVGTTDGTPVIDFTGSPRGEIKNIYFTTTTTAHPSCAILMARNSTSGYAGGHKVENVTLFGNFTVAGIVLISSECNVFKELVINNYSEGADCIFIGQSVPSGISSPFIGTIGTVGGATRNRFYNCETSQFNSVSGDCIELSDVDTISFISCYTKAKSGAALRIAGRTSNIAILDIRDESEGQYFMQVDEDVTLSEIFITGRTSRALKGEDGSVVSNSKINLGFIATSSSYAVDFYDFINSELLGFATQARVRNSARASHFISPRTYKIAPDRSGALDLDILGDGAGATGLKYTISYAGGSVNYQTHVMGRSIYDRHVFNNVIATSFINSTKYVWPDDVAAGTSISPFTPKVTAHGPVWVFELDQNLVLNNAEDEWKIVDDPQEGMILTMVFKQDSTGSRTVSFGSNYVLNGWQVQQSSNAVSIARFYVVKLKDGTKRFVKI